MKRMKNKITFFRFYKSEHIFDKEKEKGDIDVLFLKENYKEALDKHPIKSHRKINQIESDILRDFRVFLSQKNNHLSNEVFEPSRKSPIETLDLLVKEVDECSLKNKPKLKEALLQHNYNYIFNYHRTQEDYEKKGVHNRVDFRDIKELNKITTKMNKKGWSIKQIEGIQSGNHKIRTCNDGGAGYGYGFTEGILVVWEKT
jgi:hypothetical protein